MKNFKTRVFLLAITVLATPAWAAPRPEASLPDLVDQVLPSVVNISASRESNSRAVMMDEYFRFFVLPKSTQATLGTGMILDREGLVITNSHVVKGAQDIVFTLNDKRVYRGRIVGIDSKMDLALLQMHEIKSNAVPKNIRGLELGDSDKVRIGESVFAVGQPFGLQNTVTRGIISAKNRTLGAGPFDNFLQTDTPINEGNSGGPLLNYEGKVIGINTMIYSKTGQSAGLSFAIPINEAKTQLETLKKYGRVPRPWLGVLAQQISPQVQYYYNIPTEQGVLIFNLVDRGPADRAGVRIGDVIVSVGGQKVEELYDIERTLAQTKPGEKLPITLLRKGKKVDLTLKAEELPGKIEELPPGVI